MIGSFLVVFMLLVIGSSGLSTAELVSESEGNDSLTYPLPEVGIAFVFGRIKNPHIEGDRLYFDAISVIGFGVDGISLLSFNYVRGEEEYIPSRFFGFVTHRWVFAFFIYDAWLPY